MAKEIEISQISTQIDSDIPILDKTWMVTTEDFNLNDDTDYYLQMGDVKRYIWSIGKSSNGLFFMALDSRFYPSTDQIECVWLR